MIELINLSKTYRLQGREKKVAQDINFTLKDGEKLGLLGRNGAGKSSLLRMIAGTMDPDAGEIRSDGKISWPVGFAGSFHPDLTGVQNARFVARIYGVDSDALCDFVEGFAELDTHFSLPVRTYSSGMRARLAFATSMGIDFDTYLVDEVTSVGDASFKQKSEQLFLERTEGKSAVMVSHALGMIERTCDAVAVLEGGKLTYHRNVMAGIAHHQKLMRREGP